MEICNYKTILFSILFMASMMNVASGQEPVLKLTMSPTTASDAKTCAEELTSVEECKTMYRNEFGNDPPNVKEKDDTTLARCVMTKDWGVVFYPNSNAQPCKAWWAGMDNILGNYGCYCKTLVSFSEERGREERKSKDKNRKLKNEKRKLEAEEQKKLRTLGQTCWDKGGDDKERDNACKGWENVCARINYEGRYFGGPFDHRCSLDVGRAAQSAQHNIEKTMDAAAQSAMDFVKHEALDKCAKIIVQLWDMSIGKVCTAFASFLGNRLLSEIGGVFKMQINNEISKVADKIVDFLDTLLVQTIPDRMNNIIKTSVLTGVFSAMGLNYEDYDTGGESNRLLATNEPIDSFLDQLSDIMNTIAKKFVEEVREVVGDLKEFAAQFIELLIHILASTIIDTVSSPIYVVIAKIVGMIEDAATMAASPLGTGGIAIVKITFKMINDQISGWASGVSEQAYDMISGVINKFLNQYVIPLFPEEVQDFMKTDIERMKETTMEDNAESLASMLEGAAVNSTQMVANMVMEEMQHENKFKNVMMNL